MNERTEDDTVDPETLVPACPFLGFIIRIAYTHMWDVGLQFLGDVGKKRQ